MKDLINLFVTVIAMLDDDRYRGTASSYDVERTAEVEESALAAVRT